MLAIHEEMARSSFTLTRADMITGRMSAAIRGELRWRDLLHFGIHEHKQAAGRLLDKCRCRCLSFGAAAVRSV